MSKKAYGEFMKSNSSSKKKIGDLKLVSRRDNVYGRVLELEKLFSTLMISMKMQLLYTS